MVPLSGLQSITKFLQCTIVFRSLYHFLFYETGPCGAKRVHHTWSPQIVAGTYAKLGEWPWQVQLGYSDNTESIPHLCGGSILDHYWIVTAAHCLKRELQAKPPANFNVTVGKDLNKLDCSNGAEKALSGLVWIFQNFIRCSFTHGMFLNLQESFTGVLMKEVSRTYL